MKITTWNVRGICSRFKMHEVWSALLHNQWDVLCVVEHKEHKNAGLMLNTKGYTLCYSGKVKGDYSRVVMFIIDVFCPQVIFTDDLGRFLVVQISYEGQVLWLVGVYASNLPQKRSLLCKIWLPFLSKVK